MNKLKKEFVKKLESLVPMKLEKLEYELFMWVESKFKEEKQSILKAIMKNKPKRNLQMGAMYNCAIEEYDKFINKLLK